MLRIIFRTLTISNVTHIKEPSGLKSDERGDHATNSPRQMHHLEYLTLKTRPTIKMKCAGAYLIKTAKTYMGLMAQVEQSETHLLQEKYVIFRAILNVIFLWIIFR